ncbi:MAG: hypothetical protein EX267_02850 [Acidimicrobiia bacterium]|nr:MAG: hypothetical protein EX267_02850 [Acidimicrobiia bacterium]
MKRIQYGSDDGITIVELAISSFILLIIGAIMLTALLMVARTNEAVAQDTESLTTARIARHRLEQEIRQADAVLPTSSSTSIDLWLDENNDDIQDPNELITWAFKDLDGTPGGKAQLVRSVADTAIGDRVDGIHYRSPAGGAYSPFTYSGTPPAVQQVTLTLIVEPESDSGGGESVTLESTVTPRNTN